MHDQIPYEQPENLTAALHVTTQIVHAYLSAIRFIIADAARDPNFSATHLLSYVSQDIIESAAAMLFQARSGSLSVPRRELRFIVESSVKLSYVQQKNYHSSVEDKLKQFDKHLSSSSISIKRDLNLSMLPVSLRQEFDEEVGRLYGKTSTYVHLTPEQIMRRIAAVDSGRTIGFENAAEVEEINLLISRGFATSIVLLLHSVSEYVAGDWLVDSDGTTINSYFLGSRFVAAIDSYFDYKAERQVKLNSVQSARSVGVRF